MTNYNERLDEVLYRFAVDTHESKPGQDETPNFDKAKQLITSLIKELVAEAKPEDNCMDCNGVMQFEQNLLKALEEK